MPHKLGRFLAAALLAAVAAGAGAGCLQNMPTTDMSDAAVTARVKAELKAHRNAKVQYLDVSTNLGVVTISGMVDSAETRRQVQKIVYRVPGLKQLILNLLVQE